MLLGNRHAYHVHGKSDREVEGIESSLVNDNEVVPATKESASSPALAGIIMYFSRENLFKSTWSSGAVMRSTNWPSSVWKVVSRKSSIKST